MYNSTEIENVIEMLASEGKHRISESNPIVVSVLGGGFRLHAELIKRWNFPLQVDFLKVDRGYDGQTGERVSWFLYPTISPVGRTVVLVDDIIDEGIKLAEVISYYSRRGADRIIVVALCEKDNGGILPGPWERVDDICAGLKIPSTCNAYGMGMDRKGYDQNLNEVLCI